MNTIEESTDTFPSSTTSESKLLFFFFGINNSFTFSFYLAEKLEPETPPIQTTPVNPIYHSSSPSTSLPPQPLPPTNALVPPHYYPQPTHHNVIYQHHIPPAASNGLYPIQPYVY